MPGGTCATSATQSALRHWWSRLTEHEQLERQEVYTTALEAWRVANERRLEERFRAQTGR